MKRKAIVVPLVWGPPRKQNLNKNIGADSLLVVIPGKRKGPERKTRKEGKTVGKVAT